MLDSPTSGKIFVEGKDISTLSNNELSEYRAEKVGFVFQFYNLVPTLTVHENVSLVKEISKNSLSATKMIEEVGLPDHLKNFPSELSGGEQQCVSIARALAKNPKILLCDEPTGALDYETGVLVTKLASEYEMKSAIGAAVIFSSALTIAMSLLVSLAVARKNKKTDMAEALKFSE